MDASFNIDLNLGKLGNDNRVLDKPLFVLVPEEYILLNKTPFWDNASKCGVIWLVSPNTPVKLPANASIKMRTTL